MACEAPLPIGPPLHSSPLPSAVLDTLLLVHAAPVERRGLAESLAGARIVELGVGPARAAMNLTRALTLGPPPALVLAFGVCGVLPPFPLAVGDLCVVARDCLADEGVETESGFLDLQALGLAEDTSFTAHADATARAAAALGAPSLAGATVSTGSATDARAHAIAARTGAAVETMEGAAIALVCARFAVPWVQVRAVSNRCGDRARGAWDLDRALAALHGVLPAAVTAAAGAVADRPGPG